MSKSNSFAGFDAKWVAEREAAMAGKKPVKTSAAGKPKDIPTDETIFIPYNVPSSKNEKQIGYKFIGERKIPFIMERKIVKEYREVTKRYWELLGKVFRLQLVGKSKPYTVEFLFVRSSKRHFDFHNAVQLPADLMQEYGWIDDDDMDNLLPVPPLPPDVPYIVDKNNPGVFIKIL